MADLRRFTIGLFLAFTSAVHGADYDALRKQADGIRDAIDSAISDTSNDSMAQRRARVYKATQEGIAFIKDVTADESLSRQERRDLMQDVAGEIGFAYYEAVKPILPASMIQNPGSLDPEPGEKRWSFSYLSRTVLPWLQVAAFGVLRDVTVALSPVLPGIQKGLPADYVADDSALQAQAGDRFTWGWKVPEFLPYIGPSKSIDRWSHKMAKSVTQAYEEIKARTQPDAREAGFEAIATIFEDSLAEVDADGVDDSRTMMEGPQHRFQQGLYVALGLVMATYGFDMYDLGSEYVTQSGVFMSRITWAAMAYAMFHTRRYTSTVRAYSKLQGLVNDLKVSYPDAFNPQQLAEADKVATELRDAECEVNLVDRMNEGAMPASKEPVIKPVRKSKKSARKAPKPIE